ncbi:hypothetical protein [Amycolatopsis azurea]|uniref:Uncharacterized protein n=1 Tax=Amycolatopsis azurea DSM 43854 TaxID=1238180 RepID=M2PEB4_9PSEU|nr:hypothetical protein [Amycolatopsis azurea]EMD22713.1 hypothetical protein C791_8037 [Amycolatopsis azurea DSM 43854]OOC00870.1 hypothetical protein B0293_41055 [Amycolatopsis azurea DSM 43854]
MHDEHSAQFDPWSVADLAADPAWKVTHAGTTGQWLTAERIIERDEGRWLIGLTPVLPDAVALILWSDGEVVEHLRGTEAETCATAHRLVRQILAGSG